MPRAEAGKAKTRRVGGIGRERVWNWSRRRNFSSPPRRPPSFIASNFQNYMADEPQVPAQTEGAGQPTKKKPAPVNLAMVEAAERGLDLDPAPPPKTTAKSATPAEPPP